ncbi:MAG: UDP-N-acetylglucosamine 2-epimerase, partial [bacterium]
SNVDDGDTFAAIIDALEEIASDIPIIFPAHPRTVKNIEKFGFKSRFKAWEGRGGVSDGLYILDPLGYLQYQRLTIGAKLVLTDSGGIQEETTYLGIPCITIRENTERPVTVDVGTNIIVGADGEKIVRAAKEVLSGSWKKGRVPELWDGRAAVRIVGILEKSLS